ncbi:hypothetical protein CAAN3_02S10264 [[Candida] anglica]
MIGSSESELAVCFFFKFVIATITYLHGIFEEENYQVKEVGSIRCRELVKGVSKEADTLISWIEEGVIRFLQQGQLVTLFFNIGNLTYSFRCQYGFESIPTMSINDFEINSSNIFDTIVSLILKLEQIIQYQILEFKGEKEISFNIEYHEDKEINIPSMFEKLNNNFEMKRRKPKLLLNALYSKVSMDYTMTYPPIDSKVEIEIAIKNCECDTNKELTPDKILNKNNIDYCIKCSRCIHNYCYGNFTSKILQKDKTCYTCMFPQSIPKDLKLLMRIRFLWKYISEIDLPSSTNELIELFQNDKDSVIEVLNTMIQHNILETSKQVHAVKGKLKTKTKFIKITVDGIQFEYDQPIPIDEIKYFIFSPYAIHKSVPNLNYELAKKDQVFPCRTTVQTETSILQDCTDFFQSREPLKDITTAKKDNLDSAANPVQPENTTTIKPQVSMEDTSLIMQQLVSTTPHLNEPGVISQLMDANKLSHDGNAREDIKKYMTNDMSFEETLHILSQVPPKI